MNLYPRNLKNWYLERAKTPGLNDPKKDSIRQYEPFLGSFNRGDFRAAPNANFSGFLGILLKSLTCVFVLGFCLYVYIDRQNEVTELRLTVPALTEDIRVIQEKNARLQYGIERFESPLRLIELLRKPEFRHLKHPYVSDILEIPAGEPLKQHE
jgi:hypothetical protein